MDAASLWYHSERILRELRNTADFRDALIPELYNQLFMASNEITAVGITTILYTRIMNAVERGHETEPFANAPMCRAIVNLLHGNLVFQAMIGAFFENEIGNDGQKVVIAQSDPMLTTLTLDNLDEQGRKEIERIKGVVLEKTSGLKLYFRDYWDKWVRLWDAILLDSELYSLMLKKEPNTTDWGINKKMVCNVVGMFNEKNSIGAKINALSKTISKSSVRAYISNPRDEGSNSAFNNKQYERINKMIATL